MDHALLAELNRLSNALNNLEVLLRDIRTSTARQGSLLDRIASTLEKQNEMLSKALEERAKSRRESSAAESP